MTQTQPALVDLYLKDETAWLDAMVELLEAGAFAELDYSNLQEFLTDIAKRDRREVQSRLVVLILHILKWQHQPDARSGSWKACILEQSQEHEDLVDQGVLRNHAIGVLDRCQERGVVRTGSETGLPTTAFPEKCPYTLDQLVGFVPRD